MAKLSRKNCLDSILFKQLGRSDSGGTTVYYSYSIFSYILVYYISVKKKDWYILYPLVTVRLAARSPSAPLRSPCGHLEATVRLPWKFYGRRRDALGSPCDIKSKTVRHPHVFGLHNL